MTALSSVHAEHTAAVSDSGIESLEHHGDTAAVAFACNCNSEAREGESQAEFSIFTQCEKRCIIVCAGICAFLSPISGQIYLPSIETIATDLHVSSSKVNLTITTYLLMQGLAPAFVGNLSDNSGRRPAYILCFMIYMAANIALGLQSNYVALLVLRGIQSAGSSGTVALANAVVSDMITSQERGVYVSYLSIAPQAGPALGPLIGGLLGQHLGWHSVFWFLLICATVVFLPVLLLFPETCRKIVGNGSVPPPSWDRCLFNNRLETRTSKAGVALHREGMTVNTKLKLPNPFAAVRILATKEAGLPVLYGAFIACGNYATVALIPSQFGSIYHFDELQIALCYLPLGGGSLLAAIVRGRVLDARYRYHARRLGLPVERNRHQDLAGFPIERVRLEVALPTLAIGSLCIIGFGWMIQYKANLAGPLIFLSIIGFCLSASMNTVAVLLVDIFPDNAGTATAANNLGRCWIGAAGTSAVVPMIEKIGIGWTMTIFAGLIIGFSPILWFIMIHGPKWRQASAEKRVRARPASV